MPFWAFPETFKWCVLNQHILKYLLCTPGSIHLVGLKRNETRVFYIINYTNYRVCGALQSINFIRIKQSESTWSMSSPCELFPTVLESFIGSFGQSWRAIEAVEWGQIRISWWIRIRDENQIENLEREKWIFENSFKIGKYTLSIWNKYWKLEKEEM